MTAQRGLFDAPYQPSSATSRAAAEQIVPHLSAQERQVLAALARAPASGLNQYEMHRVTGLERASLCARCNALEKRGLIARWRYAGREVTRETGSGRQAVVYVLTAAGDASLTGGAA